MQDRVDRAANQDLIPMNLSGLQMNDRLEISFDFFLPKHLMQELLA
jgi:hypothetical protein